MHNMRTWFLYSFYQNIKGSIGQTMIFRIDPNNGKPDTKRNTCTHRTPGTGAGVLTNRPERANELHEDIRMIFCPT